MNVATRLDVAFGEAPGPVFVTCICQTLTERLDALLTVAPVFGLMYVNASLCLVTCRCDTRSKSIIAARTQGSHAWRLAGSSSARCTGLSVAPNQLPTMPSRCLIRPSVT